MHSNSSCLEDTIFVNVCLGAPGLKVLSPDRMKEERRREGGRKRREGGIEEWTDTGSKGGGVWLGEDGE